MTVLGVLQALALAVAAIGGAGGIVALLKVKPQNRKLFAEAYRAGLEGSEVLDRRAVSLIDAYVEQVRYLTGELEASRRESRAAREESATLRTELAAAMKRITDLEATLSGLATS